MVDVLIDTAHGRSIDPPDAEAVRAAADCAPPQVDGMLRRAAENTE